MISLKQFLKENEEDEDYVYEHPKVTEKHNELSGHYKFDKDEQYHLKKYTNDSSLTNRYLWKKHKGEIEARPNNEYTVKTLSTALRQSDAPNDFHVYSGLKEDPRKKMNSEGIMHHPAFISASLNPNVAKSFAISHKSYSEDPSEIHSLKVHIPEGSYHGSYIGHISHAPIEKEFLIDKGKNLKIIHTEQLPEETLHGNRIIHFVHHAEIV